MKIPKPTDEDRERFNRLVPDEPNVEVKPMFGNLGAFVNGRMFMGLFGSSIGLKLPEADQRRLLAEPGAGPFGPRSARWVATSPCRPTGLRGGQRRGGIGRSSTSRRCHPKASRRTSDDILPRSRCSSP
jgi:TfoX N-terminal domain